MKRINIPTCIILTALTLGLAACGARNTPAGEATTADRLNADYENALPVESQLILGTLMLEGTDNAVTAEQAAELLPMWQMMKELESSGTAATEEEGGLIAQIQETMTAEQIQAIAAMKLTQADAFDYMQKAGLMQRPPQTGTQAASGSTGGSFPGDAGGGPPAGFDSGGGMPAGGGAPPFGGGPDGANGGANLTSQQIATLEARRASGGGGRNSSVLIDALITLLETKQAA